jgi:hypothetical protein
VADQDASGAPPGTVDPADAEDPLAADRRTLVIGASAMVALVLVGVVSAQLFARGGCARVISPEPATIAAGDAAPEVIVDDVLGPVDGARAVDIVEQAAGSPVVAAFPVGEADGVAALDGGLVTTGRTVTSFDETLTPVATATTDDLVVGDGRVVFAVTVPNDLTGQADAFVPLDGSDLDVGTCVDTAVVGSPFAFLLDAGDDELLLFRADEDGGGPHLQLRDAAAATAWEARLTLPVGPPGTLAERLTARLGPDAVVAARRVGPQEETDTPALVAVSRADGTPRFEQRGDDLAEAAGLDPAEPIRWQVAAVGRETVLVHGRPDPQDVPETEEGEALQHGSLLVLDLDSGAPTATVSGVGPLVTASADPDDARAEDRYAITLDGPGNGADELTFLTADGTVDSLGSLVTDARLTWAGDEVLVAARDSLSRLAPDEAAPTIAVLVGGRFADVAVTTDGRVAALVTPRDGGDAVLLVTAVAEAVAAGG